MIQIGGVFTALCQKEGILLPKYRDRNGRCIAILFKSIGVRHRFDSPGAWDEPQTEISKFLCLCGVLMGPTMGHMMGGVMCDGSVMQWVGSCVLRVIT